MIFGGLQRGPLALTITAALFSVGIGPSAAQTSAANPDDVSENEIVVTGFPEIVVNGRATRCQPVAGDPLDDVNIQVQMDPHTGMPMPAYLAIVPDGGNGYVSVPNNEQITGPDFWQRVGVGMDQYVFRAPSANRPMCLGGRSGINQFAGYRRIVDATPYRGHRLRFTAWVATGRARQVNFWLAAGTEWKERPRRFERTPSNALLNGGNTNGVPFGGDHGWTPVLLETGPIHQDADHISYGFNLQGSGDVWVYDPKLEVVADQSADTVPEELVAMFGRDDG